MRIQKHESNQLVEEYMLLANMQIARFISHFAKEKAILRTQLPPGADNADEFIEYCKQIGVEADLSSSFATNASFEAIRKSGERAKFMVPS